MQSIFYYNAFLSILFKFHYFTGYGTRTPKTIYTDNNPIAGINQWLWADAFYFKDLDNHHFWHSKDRLLNLALIYHHVYQSYDYAAYALKKYDTKNHTWYFEQLRSCGKALNIYLKLLITRILLCTI